MTYKPLYKQNELLLGTSDEVVIVTGWTPISKIAQYLRPEQYACIGNLYSKSLGIEYLLRNLLANPEIDHVISYKGRKEDENAGSLDVLKAFWLYGTKSLKDHQWVIRSGEHLGYISDEIELEHIAELRSSILFTEVFNIEDLLVAISDHAYFHGDLPKRSGIVVSMKESKVLSAAKLNSISTESSNMWSCWLNLLQQILLYGSCPGESEYGARLEVLGFQNSFDMTDIEAPKNLKQEIISGEVLKSYATYFTQSSSEDSYTYADRLKLSGQVLSACKTLASNPSSNRAWVSTWVIEKDSLEGAEPPCFIGASVKIVEDKLWLLATFRSQDILSAWVPNSLGLIGLANSLIEELKHYGLELTLGTLVCSVSSAHIYMDRVGDAQKVLKDNPITSHFSADKSGNYVIGENDELEWQHVNTGIKYRSYPNRHSWNTVKQIITDNPQINAAHAAYLGWSAAQRSYE